MKTKFELYNGKAPLNKWHLVHSINGELQEHLYVRFIFVWSAYGVKLDHAPVGQDLIIELEYRRFMPV